MDFSPILSRGFFCADAVRPHFSVLHAVFKFFHFLEVFSIATTTHEINEQIRDPQVRLISEEGEQLGIVSAEEALRIATEAGYDLVKIAPNSVPPVCRIMDYGKFRFEQTKKEKEAKKNQRVIEIKEIRMSPGIDTNDFNTKLKNAQKFLGDGDRVKVSVRFRGREMAHTEIGADLLKDFAEKCAEIANMDSGPPEGLCRKVCGDCQYGQGPQARGTQHVHVPLSEARCSGEEAGQTQAA